MNKYYLVIAIFTILPLTSCDSNCVNKDRDFQAIKNQLLENLNVNSIEIKSKENLL